MTPANELLRGEQTKARAAIPVLTEIHAKLLNLQLPDPADYARNLHLEALLATDNLLAHAYAVIGRVAMQDAEDEAGKRADGLDAMRAASIEHGVHPIVAAKLEGRTSWTCSGIENEAEHAPREIIPGGTCDDCGKEDPR